MKITYLVFDEIAQGRLRVATKADAKALTVNNCFKLWVELKRGIKDSTFKNYIYMYEMFVIGL